MYRSYNQWFTFFLTLEMPLKLRACGVWRLFEAYHADDECDRMNGGERQFEWVVFLIIGNNKDVILVAARLDSLD